MLNKIVAVFCIAGILFVAGCATHYHQVGQGAQGPIETVEARQWYVLWGLVPINDVDTHSMAGGTPDYDITTQTTFIDFIISAFTNYVSVNCRTVTVEK